MPGKPWSATVGRRGGLRISFIEVKFRRYLKTARTTDLVETITGQLDASRARWEKLFGQATTALEKTVQQARLARVLRFYARKGRRHTLSEDAFERIERELLKLSREGTQYLLPALDEQERPGVGFVFCPEYEAAVPVSIGDDIWLFGPALLPESQRGEVSSMPAMLDPLPRELFAPSDKVTLYADRIKQIGKFKAWFYTEGMRTPVQIVLSSGLN